MLRTDVARNAGFTLVEVLVAVAILALVATIAWRGTAAMTDAEAKLAVESARWQQLDALVARLEGDVRLALPRMPLFLKALNKVVLVPRPSYRA